MAELFELAAAHVSKHGQALSDDIRLKLYGLYSQVGVAMDML